MRRGVPAAEAYMQDYKKSEAKQRLFADVRAGRVRVLIGSSQTMGSGVNAQLRLKALHHLDMPWLPSHIEQREGRIVRQGNQHTQVDIYSYATEGSLDATMRQKSERNARFHRRRALRLYLDPQARGSRRRTGQLVRHGQSDRQ